MRGLGDLLDLVGRAMLGLTFIYWGGRKLADILGLGAPELGGWTAYMEAQGVPGLLLPLVILTEISFGLMLVLGWKVRAAGLALAGFCLLANLFFHTGFGLPPPAGLFNWVVFLKNFAVAGGLLVIAGRGAGAWSLDRRAADRRGGPFHRS